MISIGIFDTLNRNRDVLNVTKLYYLWYEVYLWCNIYKWYLNSKKNIDGYIKGRINLLILFNYFLVINRIVDRFNLSVLFSDNKKTKKKVIFKILIIKFYSIV